MSTRTETPQHETYEALRAEIARRHPRFSDRLKVIAEFALDHPTEIALGTVAEVAQRAKVQPSLQHSPGNAYWLSKTKSSAALW